MENLNSKNIINGLKVSVLKTRKLNKSSAAALFNVKYFSIILICSGSLSIELENINKQLLANELLIVPVNTSLRILDSSIPLEIYLLSFSPDFAFSNSIKKPFIGFFDYFISKSFPKISLKNKEASRVRLLIKLLRSSSSSYNRHFFTSEVVLFNFNTLLYEIAGLYQSQFKNITVQQTRREKLVIEFYQILQANFKKQHGVSFYANAIFITPVHLSRTVKEITGKTAKQHIEQALILEAKILLENNNLTILNVMEELAFNTLSFFSNFFKRHTSMSPTEYRLSQKF